MSVINSMLQGLDKRGGAPGDPAFGAGDLIRAVERPRAWSKGRIGAVALAGVAGATAAGLLWSWQTHAHGVAGVGPVAVAAAPVVATPVGVAPAVVAPADAVQADATSADATAANPRTDSRPQGPGTRATARAHEPATPVAVTPVDTHAIAATVPTFPVTPRPPQPAPAPLDAVSAVAMPSASSGSRALPMDVAPPVPSASTNKPVADEPADLPRARAPAPGPRTAAGKSYSPRQLAANLHEEATDFLEQGRGDDAVGPLQRLLAADPLDVRARQMLVQAQLAAGRAAEARALLVEGQRLVPSQPAFAITLARLDIEAGDLGGAVQRLEAARAGAHGDPAYHAFLAALLVRAQRYGEAVQDYLAALRTDPANGPWLVGTGVALEGAGKPTDALEAYRRAADAPSLPPDLARFLNERVARLTH